MKAQRDLTAALGLLIMTLGCGGGTYVDRMEQRVQELKTEAAAPKAAGAATEAKKSADPMDDFEAAEAARLEEEAAAARAEAEETARAEAEADAQEAARAGAPAGGTAENGEPPASEEPPAEESAEEDSDEK